MLALLLTPPAAIADQAKVVNLYNWSDYIGEDTLANFTAETGIRVNYDNYDSSEIVDAKMMTGASGYDLIVHAASHTARLLPIGLFAPLDRSRLPHWNDLNPQVMRMLASYDPGNQHGVPYMWGSTGFTYNHDLIMERMPEAPVHSADMLFDPQVISRFADCGVSFLDAPTDMLPVAMIYLGHDSNSIVPEHLRQAGELLRAVRPFVRYFDSTKMLLDLPSQEVCLAVSWSGDYATAQWRAAQAGIDIDLRYTVPKEGSSSWFDALWIPRDAPHPDNAYQLLAYLMRPQVVADITNQTHYANGVDTALPLVDPAIAQDSAVYPTEEIIKRLSPTRPLPPKAERARTRVWTRVKLGL